MSAGRTRVKCPSCGIGLMVADHRLGQTAQCPACAAPLVLGSDEPVQTEPEDDALQQLDGFSEIPGALSSLKESLIKRLAAKRMESLPLPPPAGFDLEDLPDFVLLGLPEATIVTCVETYALARAQGLPEAEVLRDIEAHRSSLGQVEGDAGKLTLREYIYQRVEIEHGHGMPVSSEFCDFAVDEALRSYSIIE